MANNTHDEERNFFWRFDGWGAPIAGVLIVLLLLIGISVNQAEATDNSIEECSGEDCVEESDRRWGFERHGRRHHGHHGRRGGWGRHDPERAKEHMHFATGWMLRRFDVEDDVRGQIQARFDTAFDALAPLVEAHKESRDTWLESMLEGETVDRTALASQRESTLDAAAEAMEIVTDALADAADLLTPEQRAEIAEKIRRHRH